MTAEVLDFKGGRQSDVHKTRQVLQFPVDNLYGLLSDLHTGQKRTILAPGSFTAMRTIPMQDKEIGAEERGFNEWVRW